VVAFYVVGAALVLVLPALVWRRHKWLTRVIASAPLQGLSLCWRQGRLLRGTSGPVDVATEAANRATLAYDCSSSRSPHRGGAPVPAGFGRLGPRGLPDCLLRHADRELATVCERRNSSSACSWRA